jgi:poly(3-hydroxybutyrate) depolymerase
MKKALLTLTAFILTLVCATAQERYLDEIFPDSVVLTPSQVYGDNWYFFASNVEDFVLSPNPQDSPYVAQLKMDIRAPFGDTATNRIPVIVLHTGNFIPRYFNGSTTGSRQDKSVVDISEKLAKRGFVAFAPSYRLGWDPLNSSADVRKGTLLNAVYRGLSDVKTCVRFLKKTVAEDSNPYGIDPSKVVLFGYGTGGYLATNYGALDRMAELEIEKFTDVDGNLFVDTSLVGQIDGSGGLLNVHNHPDYSNDIMASVNAGGAVGDSSWIEAGENLVMSFHCPDDPFAPFNQGIVIVPTTNENVVPVSGSKYIIGQANALGNNAAIASQTYTDPISMASYAALSSSHPALGLDPNNYEGLFPFIRPTVGPSQEESSPWDWWIPAEVSGSIDFINNLAGTELDADFLMTSSLFNNPSMSAVQGQAYIDTIVGYMAPRLVYTMVAGVEESNALISENTFIYPNPTSAGITIRVDGFKMNAVEIYNLNGALVADRRNLNSGRLEMNVEGLSLGLYLVRVLTDEGFTTRKLSVR